MELSKDLVKQFAGLMNTPETKKDTPYLFGTAIVNESGINVKIDGSQYITPASSTIGVKNNDRVAILLKNHKAIIMGNATSPAYSGAQTDDKFATTEDLESVSGVNSDVIEAIKEMQSATDKYNKMYQMVSKWSATGAVAPDVKINGGLLEAYTVISKHIAIGDFTNMVVLQTSDFTISNDIGQRYRRVTGAYGAIELASSKEVEFEVGDSYLFTFKCYSVIGTVNCIIRYYYSDGTWSDAGLTTLTFAVNKLDKFDVIVKIKSLPTKNKTLTKVRYFIETTNDTNNVFDLYQEDLALRKMYAGKLIVDGSITAKSIDAEQFFTGKVGDKANSLFASLGAFEETKNLLDATNALVNLNSSSLGELNTELEANITNTNNALKSIDDLNKSFDSFKSEGNKYSVMYKMISKWANGAVKEDTLINGGLIATDTILAKHIAIGDFTNMVNYQASDFDLVDQDGNPMRRKSDSSYARMVLTTTKRIEFEVGDSYLFTFFAKMSYSKANCFIRYIYTDGTWENAGSTTFDVNVNKVEKHNVKVVIKTPLNTNKTLSYTQFLIEVSSTSECTLDLYMKDLALRKMYGGNLIVDGTITADHLDANSLFVGAVGDKANELFATVDGLLKANQKITTVEGIANGAANDIITIDGQITNLETATNKNTQGLKDANQKITTVEGIANGAANDIITIDGQITNLETATNKNTQGLKDANKNISTNTSLINTINGKIKNYDTNFTKYDGMYKMVSKWANGAINEATLINGGLIATDTILAKHIAIGDFTNMVNYQASDFDLVDENGNPMRRASSSSYARMNLTSTKRIEFEVGDSYLFTFFAKLSYSTAACIIRYIYSDGTWENAGGNTFNATVNKVEKHNVKVVITTPLNTSKTLSYITFFIEVASASSCTLDLYMKDLALRKMYGGNLIVDGTITATHLDANSLFVGAVGDKAKELFATVDGLLEANRKITTVEGIANGAANDIITIDGQITNLETATNKNTQGLKDANQNISTNASSISTINGKLNDYDSTFTTYDGMYKMVSKWANGAIKEGTLINGGLIATDTILAKHIAIGDFTNMVDYQPSDFNSVDGNGNPMKGISSSSYASLPLTTTKRVEFEVGDSYLFTFIAKISYFNSGSTGKAACIIRYTYSDDTWENAGSTTFDATSEKVEKHEIKVEITTPLNTSKTLSYITFFIEVDHTSSCALYLYMKDLALRKMYGGNLIVDGTISARHLNVDELFARKLHSHNGSIMFTDDVSWNDRMTSTTIINGTNIILRPNINNKNGRPCRFRLGYLFNSDSSLSNLELRMGTQDVIDVGNLYSEQIHLRHCSGINSNGYPEYDHTRQIWLAGDGRIHCDAAIMTQDAIIMDNSKALYCKDTSASWVHAISVGEDNSARVFTWYTGGNLRVGNANTPETHVSGKKVYLKGQGYVNNSLISTSDANLKNTPTSFDERYYRLAEMLNFKLFRFNDGTSGRFHSGLYAQEVEECMAECGISMDECAFVCIDQTEDENGNNQVIHSLRYDEINNLMNWYTRERIRRQDVRLQALEEQNMMLMNEISELKS